MKAIKKGLYDTKFFAEYWLGIKLNPYQERISQQLDEALWGGRYAAEDLLEVLLKAGNRSGKTVMLAIIHIKFAYYKIGVIGGDGYENFKYRTFAISPISRPAQECAKYIEDILEGRMTWQFEGKRFSNRESLKLKNFFAGKNEATKEYRYANSAITYVFSTGEDQGAGLQGQPAALVTYDECVHSHHLETELDSNIYSRLGDYGKMIMLISTPSEEAKSQQYFYHLCSQAKKGKNNYLLWEGSFLENIFIPEAKRQSHLKTVTDRDPVMAKQIIKGDFVSTGGAMFEPEVIEQMFKDDLKFKGPDDTHEYFISVDWGVSDKGDDTVMLVWDWTMIPIKIVHAYHKKGGDPYELMAVLKNLVIQYNDAEVIMDTGGMGGTIFKKLLKDLKPESFDAGGKGEDKGNALFYAQVLMTKGRKKHIENGEVVELNPDYGHIRAPYSPELSDQLATYKLDDKKLKQDWVSAFYIGCFKIWKRFGDKQQKQKSFQYSPFRNQLLKQKNGSRIR